MIKGIGFTHETFKFPSGEMHVKVVEIDKNEVGVDFKFEKTEEIIELMLLVNALRHIKAVLKYINVPFLPFARQDRIAVEGECFSLEVICDVLNSFNCQINVEDLHSHVANALLKNCNETKQEYLVFNTECTLKRHYLISPDGGALKKVYQSANSYTIGVVECSKQRNVKTGEITGTKIYYDDFNGEDCIILDDICDGGRTFIEIAKVLKQKNCGKVILYVTHGLFTKGLGVFDGLIDEIYTSKGRVK
jgi:ribose-phosphate pyrophosphokinase